MYELIVSILREQLDPKFRLHILRSSKDPDLAEYFDAMQSLGSTHMEPDGNIYVKIHDARGITNGTWFEEFGHALQFLKYGDVELSKDDEERRRRELELANCLMNNSSRLHLSNLDERHCRKSSEVYKRTVQW
jgi:hypothetical protein